MQVAYNLLSFYKKMLTHLRQLKNGKDKYLFAISSLSIMH